MKPLMRIFSAVPRTGIAQVRHFAVTVEESGEVRGTFISSSFNEVIQTATNWQRAFSKTLSPHFRLVNTPPHGLELVYLKVGKNGRATLYSCAELTPDELRIFNENYGKTTKATR